MRKIEKITIPVLFSLSMSVYAQLPDPPKQIKRVKVTDFSAYTALVFQTISNGTLTDFQKLAPNSQLQHLTLSNYNPNSSYGFSGTPLLSFMLGFKFADKEKQAYRKNMLARIGVSYVSGVALSGSYSHSENKPYDTLVSSQTGQTIYLDSTMSKYYYMNYFTQQLRIDASLIFRTNPLARWSLYAGVGITAGASINAFTDITYSTSRTTEYRNNNGKSLGSGEDHWSAYYNDAYTNTSERHTNAAAYVASVFIPMGVNFRLGNKKEFWKRLNLFYELRPGINTLMVPELSTLINPSFHHGVGLRVAWD